MPYGFQVRTTRGMVDLVDISTVKVVHRSRRTSASGSASLPTSVTNNVFGFAVALDDGAPPTISVGNGTVTWAADTGEGNGFGQPSTNFNLFLMRF